MQICILTLEATIIPISYWKLVLSRCVQVGRSKRLAAIAAMRL